MTYIETDKLEQAIQLHLHKRTQLPLTHLPTYFDLPLYPLRSR